ncbi:MAG: Uma2 family endonuclease [Gemmatimonadales bacterium]
MIAARRAGHQCLPVGPAVWRPAGDGAIPRSRRQHQAAHVTPILTEVESVLRKKFGWSDDQALEARREIRSIATTVRPAVHIRIITSDDADNRVLECALAGRADCIVSGDRRHLIALGSFEGIPIERPRPPLGRFARKRAVASTLFTFHISHSASRFPHFLAPRLAQLVLREARSDSTVGSALLLPNMHRRGDLMGMAAPLYYTAEMVRSLPEDGNRYETVHGELLVTPSPRLWHQDIVTRLSAALVNYIEAHPVGRVFSSPADISWGPDILVQPDILIADLEEARTLDWKNVRTLLLAVEVLSPSTARYDRFTKRRLYQEVGIPCYWIVDPHERYAEVWTPAATFPTVERDRLVWTPTKNAEPFELELAKLFRPI